MEVNFSSTFRPVNRCEVVVPGLPDRLGQVDRLGKPDQERADRPLDLDRAARVAGATPRVV